MNLPSMGTVPFDESPPLQVDPYCALLMAPPISFASSCNNLELSSPQSLATALQSADANLMRKLEDL
jgi:hypothetical protein